MKGTSLSFVAFIFSNLHKIIRIYLKKGGNKDDKKGIIMVDDFHIDFKH